jgi:hypothetical protein
MNQKITAGAHTRAVEAMRSTPWPDYNASLGIAQKTRRAVRDAVISNQEQHHRKLRTIGFALTGFLSLMILLGPGIWNYAEDLLAGDHIFDLHNMVHFLVLMLLPAMLAALFAAMWKGKRDLQQDRGGVEKFRHIEE